MTSSTPTTMSEATRFSEPRCSCGHVLSEHVAEDRPDAHGRSMRVPGKCWAVTGEHADRERELVCRKRPHAHDGCGAYCRHEEHLHGEGCHADRERTVQERCECHAFDQRSPEERRRDEWRERRACIYCGHGEEDHLPGESYGPPRFCRKALPGYPHGWNCGDCRGYVPRDEFVNEPHRYLGSRPGAWSPPLERDAAARRTARAAREAEVERLHHEHMEGK